MPPAEPAPCAYSNLELQTDEGAGLLQGSLSHSLQQGVESSCQSHHTPRGHWTAHFCRASLTYLQLLQFQTFLKEAWLPHRVRTDSSRRTCQAEGQEPRGLAVSQFLSTGLPSVLGGLSVPVQPRLGCAIPRAHSCLSWGCDRLILLLLQLLH